MHLDLILWLYPLLVLFYLSVILRQSVKEWQEMNDWPSFVGWLLFVLFQVGVMGTLLYLFVRIEMEGGALRSL